MLATGLWNRFYEGGAVIRSGDVALAQGARDIGGQWKGHYWCEVAVGEDRFILDITADQFGHEPVRVLSYESAAGFDYRAGTQPIVDEVACELATLVGLEPKWLKPKADVIS